MAWFTLLPAVAVALLVLFVPGLVSGWIAGFRGARLVALAAPITLGLLAIASIVLPFAGIGWTPLPVLLAVLALAAAVGFLLRIFRRGEDPKPAHPVLNLVAVVLGGGVLGVTVARAIGAPGGFSQSFDNVFHLNAIRFVMDTGSASPLTVGTMTAPDLDRAFYPSGWHGLNALVAQLSGGAIPEAVNAVTLVIAAIVWPLGLLFLAQVLFGTRLRVSIAVALVLPAFAAFPLHFVFFGPLYPMLLGVSVLPVLLALTLEQALRSAEAPLAPVGVWILILGVLAGVLIAHPGVALAWLVGANLVLVCWLFMSWKRLSPRSRLVAVAVTVLIGLVSLALLWALRPADQESFWGPKSTPLAMLVKLAVGRILSPRIEPVTIALTLLGLYWLWTRRGTLSAAPYLMLLYAGFGFLYFISDAQPHGPARELLIGPWYQDPNRLGMFALIPALLVSVAALLFLFEKIGLIPSVLWRRIAAAVIAVVAAVSWIGPNVRELVKLTQDGFELDERSYLISPDEFALFEQVGEIVPEDAVIAGNAWQGAGMAFAFADRGVLMPHLFMNFSEDGALIMDELNRAEPGSAVCDAILHENVQYVLDFPGPSVFDKGQPFPGLKDLGDSDAVELVASEGDAKLYRVTACG